MNKLDVLLLGGGGREHALAWKISQSPLLNRLFIAPGNAGTMQVGTNVPIKPTDFESIKQFVLQNGIRMVVVGPEEPLVNGIHDFFLADRLLAEIPVIGPGKAGAALEGSKDFAKQFMKRHSIPTADYQTFTKETLNEALEFLQKSKSPFVLKANGLAAGKGVIICETVEQAEQELVEMLAYEKFGPASEKVVIEQYLSGIELSVFVLTDGKNFLILPEAKDYKRIGEGDTGPNTGGMGSVSPVPFADAEFMQKVEKKIIRPTIRGLAEENLPYKGFIFLGLMNVEGDPFVIEYNVRLGDPESEAIIPRIKNDLLDLFIAVANGSISEKQIEIDSRTAASVMLVSGGYPAEYEKNKWISGLDMVEDCLVFHAGTSKTENEIVTAGGRVIAVTVLHERLEEAIEKARTEATKIRFEKSYFRRDIGNDLLKF